ncbi:hypothetical protein N4D20_004424 [Salmonella enterica subsp. enterica serovar Chester]|nr:hypothetical protein [Citrobacter freundii]EJU0132755.1 hypothetical protein [Salmonella enterica subsp. enterica serovar Chester]MDN4233891.1 hypothetical protein [Citrobacter freundii]
MSTIIFIISFTVLFFITALIRETFIFGLKKLSKFLAKEKGRIYNEK